ncbi:MAG: IPT/TIG domain-containing protein [Candidatus Latescibacterota bacterium]|nr:MAG: IPT/TIG domain-containing protein [Candidatus Latescibacterota bacterium]
MRTFDAESRVLRTTNLSATKTLSDFRGVFVAVLVAVCIGSIGCSKPIKVGPEESVPGQVVDLSIEGADFEKVEDIEVTFARRPAPVVRVIDQTTVEVMVPPLEPGEVEIVVKKAGRQIGKAKTKIRPSPLRRVFFTMQDGRIELKRVRPYTGHMDRVASRGRRLSYDVLTEDGRLLYTGAIRHPEGGQFEVFGHPKPPKKRRGPVRVEGSIPFSIKIPYSEGKTIVRLYDVEKGVDLTDPRARDERRLITEFTVTDE